MLRFALTALPAAAMLLSGCATTYVRQHPEFEKRRDAIQSVAIMPTEVVLLGDTASGQHERLDELECSIAEDLLSALTEELMRRGIDARPLVSDDCMAGDSADLGTEATKLQEAYKQELTRAYATPAMPERRALSYQGTLGESVRSVADVAGADALIFTRVQGHKRSAERLSEDTVIGTMTGTYVTSEDLVLQGCLVDGTTGDLLWCNVVVRSDVEGSCREMAVQLFAPIDW